MFLHNIKPIALAAILVMPIYLISQPSFAGRGGGGADPAPVIPNWTALLGSISTDRGADVAIDSLGNVAVAGYTLDSLDGATSQGGIDAVAAMYDADGALLWSNQLGSADTDTYGEITFDNNGNIFAVGVSQFNVLLTKFDTAGNVIWSNQYGTTGNEVGSAVVTDSLGNVYVCGSTSGNFGATNTTFNDDVFLMKLDTAGTVQWIDQFSSESQAANGDDCRGMAIDSNDDIYITGFTPGAIVAGASGSEFFVKKYDSAGNTLWVMQRDSVYYHVPTDIEVDSLGNTYISATGALDTPPNVFEDALLVKLDANGVEQWNVVAASAGREAFNNVAVDDAGIIHVVGETNGALAAAGTGDTDVVHASYDTNGTQLSILQNDTASWERGRSIAVNPAGTDYYIVGDTDADLDGEINTGAYDIFTTRNRP